MREPSNENELKAAESVLEHVRMLWDDQVALAESLVEKRKALSSMLAIIVGLGVFRIQFTQKADEKLIIEGQALSCVQWCLICALSAFLVGGYFLYTQRPAIRRCCLWACDGGWRWCKYLYRLARLDPNSPERVEIDPPTPPKWPTGRAISLLLTEGELLDDWMYMEHLYVVQSRAERLREAYESLTRQNRRVANRLKNALICLFFGYSFVFVALGRYILAIG